MTFSIWEYVQARARDAMLAGFGEALDILEQGETNGQHAAAQRLKMKLGHQPEPGDDARQLPHATTHVVAAQVGTPPTASPSTAPTATAQRNGQANGAKPQAPERPADGSSFDDDLQKRLDSVAAQRGSQGGSPGNGKHSERRNGARPESTTTPFVGKRGPGRPRKDGANDRP